MWKQEPMMRQGGWASIVATYLFGVLGVAALAKLIPLRAAFEQIGASPSQFAWLIALLGIPAALLAAISGAVVDRIGPRGALIGSALIGLITDVGYTSAPSIHVFQLFRLIEGVSLVGIFSAGPALLMATTEGRRRIAAMTFWSTYTPVGFSLGLLLGGAFAGTAAWRNTFVAHGALMLLAALVGLALPRIPQIAADGSPSAGERLRALAGAYRQSAPVRLAIVFFLIISIGFGSNTVLPTYIARVHALPVATASGMIAGVNLTMIAGAFLAAMLLARGLAARTLFAGLAVIGTLTGVAIFWPGTPLGATVAILCVWYVAMGASTALLLATLPQVASAAGRAAAAGLLNQASAVATFVNPPLWLALFAGGGWASFAGLIAGGWIASAGLLWTLGRLGELPDRPRAPSGGR